MYPEVVQQPPLKDMWTMSIYYIGVMEGSYTGYIRIHFLETKLIRAGKISLRRVWGALWLRHSGKMRVLPSFEAKPELTTALL